jgi:hypothetical protein
MWSVTCPMCDAIRWHEIDYLFCQGCRTYSALAARREAIGVAYDAFLEQKYDLAGEVLLESAKTASGLVSMWYQLLLMQGQPLRR